MLNGREWGVVELAGNGPVLLLIPGTLGRGDIFWQQMAALEGRARILSVTYPETGGVAEWTGDLTALLDARGIDNATMLGSSLGGYFAQYIAATHPARVARLIAANTLHDTAPVSQTPPYISDLDAAPIAELRAGFRRGLTAWADTHPDQREMVELLLGEVGGRIPERELRNRLKGIKYAPQLPPVGVPSGNIVTIEGADDPLIPLFMREEVRAVLKPGIAYRFESGGHFPYAVRPELYTAILEEQLGLVSTGSTAWGNAGVRAL
ncbi:alpha/beta hydrolase [Aquamicrobium sp. LC103]|uniref:alpha/beta fold hydrolase n=1 Tax=Aquamicrobium sp. LC103 TaxID=1120658 RepID=UPI001485703A|nr:alpha/beta hydrolase [Aquamicrobium sp. LC103]